MSSAAIITTIILIIPHHPWADPSSRIATYPDVYPPPVCGSRSTHGEKAVVTIAMCNGQMTVFRGRKKRAFLSEAAQILSIPKFPFGGLEYPCPTCAFKFRLSKALRVSPSVSHPPFTSPGGETP